MLVETACSLDILYLIVVIFFMFPIFYFLMFFLWRISKTKCEKHFEAATIFLVITICSTIHFIVSYSIYNKSQLNDLTNPTLTPSLPPASLPHPWPACLMVHSLLNTVWLLHCLATACDIVSANQETAGTADQWERNALLLCTLRVLSFNFLTLRFDLCFVILDP